MLNNKDFKIKQLTGTGCVCSPTPHPPPQKQEDSCLQRRLQINSLRKTTDLAAILSDVLTEAVADLLEVWGSLVEFSTGLTPQRFSIHKVLLWAAQHSRLIHLIYQRMRWLLKFKISLKVPVKWLFFFFSQGDQSITLHAAIRIYRRVAQMESEGENRSLCGVLKIVAMALMAVFGLAHDAAQKYSWDIDLIVSRIDGAVICHSGREMRC